MNDYNKYFEANKQNWNKRVAIHYDSDFYNNEEFISTKNSLNEIELKELGNITGKEILHLQCHFGQDTLSLANLGGIATGVDFSEEAIKKANELSKITNIDANFICSSIFDLKDNLHSKFDIVFTSYGTIGWLPDIKKWGEIVSHFLKPGGQFLIVEFHPYIWMFDDNFEYIKYSYFHEKKPIEEIAEGTYTDGESEINLVQYSWNHTLSDVINALRENGLEINNLNEFNYSPYNCFPNMEIVDKNKFVFKKYSDKLPLVYSLSATKKQI